MQKRPAPLIGLLLPLSLVMLLGCMEEESILPGVPEKIRFINIFPHPRTNSSTIIANGKNAIEFLLELQDVNHEQVGTSPDPVRLLINGTEELTFPFRFRASMPGTYKITVKDASPEVLVMERYAIEAIEEPVYDLVTLPVVFHYVRSDSSPWTAEEQQLVQKYLSDTLAKVNSNFANLNGSPDPNAVDSYIRFELASHDPAGTLLAWPGMDFMHVPGKRFKWSHETDSLAMSGNYWDPTKYINVYILDMDWGGGYAHFPMFEPTASGIPSKPYGAFLGFSAATHYPSHVLTHEFGHVFFLYHVFGQFCSESDLCSDTWSYARDQSLQFSSLPLLKEACGGEKFQSTNHMDYRKTEGNTFTLQQVLRMRYTIDNTPFLPTPRNAGNGGRIKRPPVSGLPPNFAGEAGRPIVCEF